MQTHQSVKPLGQWDRCPVFFFLMRWGFSASFPAWAAMSGDMLTLKQPVRNVAEAMADWHVAVLPPPALPEIRVSSLEHAEYVALLLLCLQRRREAFDLHATVQCLFAVGA